VLQLQLLCRALRLAWPVTCHTVNLNLSN